MADGKRIRKANKARSRLDGAGRIAILTAFMLAGVLSEVLLAQGAPDISGNWQGTLDAGRGFRIILQISRTDHGDAGKGEWQGNFYTMGVVGARESDLRSLTLEGMVLRVAVSPDASFEGKLSSDGKSMVGTLKYGAVSYPLTLAHATPDTTWVVPQATDHLPADAAPEFEVATVKPTAPNWSSNGFHLRGRRIFCDNETAESLISFAYGVHARQIMGGPAWLTTDKFNVDGLPDLLGQPSLMQMRGMYRGLLASRFNLAVHNETREIPVYGLQVGRNGPKLAKSLGDPNGTPDQTFTRWNSQLIELKETNATLAEFSQNLGMVLDRPMVNQTDLPGKFDFVLRWTPEDAQPSDPNSPPGLFTAIQEQIGLKLYATKAAVDVVVVDHIDRPSPN